METIRKRLSWPKAAAIVAVIGAVLTALSCVFGAGAAINRHGEQLGDHETRIRTVEESLHGIAVDVRWLREDREKTIRSRP